MNSLDIKKIAINYSNIKSISIRDENSLQIERKIGTSMLILIINEENTSLELMKLLTIDNNITHVFTSSEQWDSDPDTFKYLQDNNISIITHRDLFNSIQKSNNEHQVQSKLQFIWNKLHMHSKINEVIQLNSWRILVKRKQMPDVIIGIIDTYDISSYDVYNLLRKYEKIDVIYRSNINSNITSDAKRFAEEKQIKILKFGELYSILNRDL